MVEIKDSDAIRQPDTRGGEIFFLQAAISDSKILTNDQVIVAMYPDDFDDGIGVLEGEYHIRRNESVKPVQHATPTRSGRSL